MVTYWFTECYHEAATPSRWRQHLAWTRKLIAGEYSNWFALWDQSEMNMVLMSARWVYKKSKIQENSVAACPPQQLVRRKRKGRQSMRQAVYQAASGLQGSQAVRQWCSDHRPWRSSRQGEIRTAAVCRASLDGVSPRQEGQNVATWLYYLSMRDIEYL